MNLNELFKKQAELDERIVKEKGLEGQDLLDKKILALQVELGELANEWRGFKFWSEDQEPRTSKEIIKPHADRFVLTGVVEYKNPLLEEYVDCLHFILSIGLGLGYLFNKIAKQKSQSIALHFNDLFHATAILFESIQSDWDELDKQENYDELMSSFIGLGEMLGFTWQEIEQAYFEKNKINHERQDGGY